VLMSVDENHGAAASPPTGSLEEFLFLGGIEGEYATDNRVAGFFDALRQAGVTPDEHMLACCAAIVPRMRGKRESTVSRAHWTLVVIHRIV
jgi:hypothetical protein